jgi:ribosomal protein S12 methylthiotransferase
MKKIHFTSLGCPRNWVDTEAMMQKVIDRGYVITAKESEADVLVVNTCGFLQAARLEAIEVIATLLKLKKKSAKLIAVGCMVQQFSSLLKDQFQDQIHYLLGAGDIEEILSAIESKEKGSIITDKRSHLHNEKRFIATPKHYAYLKIAEGCRKRCSYCLIPQIKGPLKSKTIPQIIREFKDLLNQGVFEVMLIAQDLSDFGKDLSIKNGLVLLIKEMLKIQKPYWLRLLYVYPDNLSEELIDLMASDERICPYIDMPLQHINDTILKKMQRSTTKAQIYSCIEKLRNKIPTIAIRTSLIVGFPQETDEEFRQLKAFLQDVKLDQVGIFPYSREEGTKAYLMPGQIDDKTKQMRVQELAFLQQRIVEKNNKKLIGKKIDVLVDGFHPDSDLLIQAHSQKQAPQIDSCFIINDPSAVSEFGKVYSVQVNSVLGYDLLCEIL